MIFLLSLVTWSNNESKFFWWFQQKYAIFFMPAAHITKIIHTLQIWTSTNLIHDGLNKLRALNVTCKKTYKFPVDPTWLHFAVSVFVQCIQSMHVIEHYDDVCFSPCVWPSIARTTCLTPSWTIAQGHKFISGRLNSTQWLPVLVDFPRNWQTYTGVYIHVCKGKGMFFCW